MNIPPIDELHHLTKQLGRAKTDRIRYLGKADTSRLRKATNIQNTVLDQMQFYEPQDRGSINDVIVGSSRMDGTRYMTLSVPRLYNILQCIEVINTREICAMMNVEKRQAQRYLRAIKFALPRIERILESKNQNFP